MAVNIENILNAVDREYEINLLRELIGIKSANPPGDCTEIANRVEAEMKSIGVDKVEIIEPAPGRRNVIGTLGKGNGPTLLMYAHLDVVPVKDDELKEWKCDPYAGEIIDGKMYGRGAADTKSGLTAMLAAARALVKAGVTLQGKVVLMAVADGETGDIMGVKYMAENNMLQGDFAIACEPSGFNIIRQFKGRIWCELNVRGKAVHASVPEEGINAVVKMAKIVEAINGLKLNYKYDQFLGHSTIAFSTISGGSVPNAVAGHCRATFDVRLVPGQTVAGVMSELQAVLDKLKSEDPELEVDLGILPGAAREQCETPEDVGIIKSISAAYKTVMGQEVSFGAGIESPGAVYHFLHAGIPGVFYGPGAIWNAHLPNEFVILDNLVNVAKTYALVALDICKEA